RRSADARRRLGGACPRDRRHRRRRNRRRWRDDGAGTRCTRRRQSPHALVERDGAQPHDGRGRRAGEARNAPAARGVLRSRSGRMSSNEIRRLAIIGMGRMGHAIASLAPERGWDVVAQLDVRHTRDGITREMLRAADVAVDFTTPEAAPANVRALIAAGCPMVVGTTGWYGELPGIAEAVRAAGGALLTAPNFSLGVTIFEQIAARAAELVRQAPGFEAHL